MLCLYPDCAISFVDDERGKRTMVDHINQTHDDAHVLIACAHEMEHQDDFDAETRRGDTAALVSIPHERLLCSRCGQFEVRAKAEDV